MSFKFLRVTKQTGLSFTSKSMNDQKGIKSNKCPYPLHETYSGSKGITPFFLNDKARCKWLTSRPGRITPRKKGRYPLYVRLSGPQIQSGSSGKKIYTFPSGNRTPGLPSLRENNFISHKLVNQQPEEVATYKLHFPLWTAIN
jgi:hypothetical protein